MKAEARNRLVQAALNGTRQGFGPERTDPCALDVVMGDGAPSELQSLYVEREPLLCPGCEMVTVLESRLLIHLNDDHHFDFLTIANKMPIDDEP